MKQLRFPDNFLWGASTSSHQVEGDTHNDWSEWEVSVKRMQELQSTQDLERWGIENFISGKAADHYNRYREDFALAQSLGHTATRFSIEWSRIEPEEGKIDVEAVRHYQDVIKVIRNLNMEPFVTLWHWTVPIWFRDKGGFTKRENISYFVKYVETMVQALPEVRFWITLNEPEIYTSNSYLQGKWPPQYKSIIKTYTVIHNLIKAHRMTYDTIKKLQPNTQIGIAKNNIYFEAYKNLPWNVVIKKCSDWMWNRYFLNKIKGKQDFIGLNHYFHNRIKTTPNHNENGRMSDLGWELYPDALYHVLKELTCYKKPIYITENGLADAKDLQRPWFLKESLQKMHQAIQEGVDVRGYLHWSLMDNFEWAHGFWPRFGLIEINYQTQQRIPRPSAYVYKEICEQNAVTVEE